jgi:HEAT repeat protein
VQFLAHKLATANASFQQQLLGALGNAGSAESLNAIAPYAKSSSPQLRAVAMMSLRLVPGSRATDLLYRGLHDPDPDVRLNAARSFQFRPFSPEDVQAFKRLISAEKMDRVRQALLENLKLEMPNYPQARTLLAQASKNDASAEIRKTVAAWLQ